MKTVFASFSDYASANTAVDELQERGFSLEEMNALVLEDVAKRQMATDQSEVNVDVTDEVGDVELHGLDRLVGGEQPVQAPEVGRVYAAGELATLLAKQFSGAGTRIFTEILQEFGVPAEAASRYESAVKSGGVLFWVRSDDARAAQAANVMGNRGASHIVSY
jgi:hypothetical protein